MPIISPLDAVILGVVEGVTEFLPISSTGHMILTSHWLGLDGGDPGSKAGLGAFEIVIQSGAILAVMAIYWRDIRAMLMGIIGRDRSGRALFLNVLVAFLPVVFIGPLAAKWIKQVLFGVWPVTVAMAAGGFLMIGVEFWRERKAGGAERAANLGTGIEAMTLGPAVVIGLAQCLAMWPGTSRSMMTIVAALLLGFKPKAAAEFSFLLAIPTLLGATVHDLWKEGDALLAASGKLGLGIGFAISFVVAWLVVRGFLSYLTRHGMKVFGYYRLVLASVLVLVFIF